jgi:hypothetical protein
MVPIQQEDAMTAVQQDPVARLVQAVKAYDKKLNDLEVAPDGDNYNVLYQLVLDMAREVSAPLPVSAPQEEPGTPTVYECPECDWTGTLDTINGIHHLEDIQDRLEPGELVPAGCCPECNSMIAVDDRDVPHHTLYEVGTIMRRRGWRVAAPQDCPSLDTIKGA